MKISTSLICLDQINIAYDISEIIRFANSDVQPEFNSNHDFEFMHADFMDGHFVPRYGIAPELIQHIRKEYPWLVIDSHLMVEDPYTYADVIAPYSNYYQFHVEAVTDPLRTIQMLRKKYPSVKIGLCFNVGTSVLSYENLFNYIDAVTIMGISPGVLGTASYPNEVLDKLQFFSIFYPKIETFVDGSVNFDTIPLYKKAGLFSAVCGSSSICKNRNFEANIEKIKGLLNS